MPLDALFDAQDEAIRDGLLPLSVDMGGSGESDLREQLVRDRLFLLGYLETPGEIGRRPELLSDAIGFFRSDAGLSVGSEIDDELFDLIDHFVRFERTDSVTEDMMDRIQGVLRYRIAAARLCAYGLFETLFPRPDKKRTSEKSIKAIKNIEKAIGTFLTILERIGIEIEETEGSLTNAALARLLDHDALAAHLELYGDKIELEQSAGYGRSQDAMMRESGREFLLMFAGIELWLTGYTVHPMVRLYGNRETRSSAVSVAIKQFWENQPSEFRPSKSVDRVYIGALFKRIKDLERTVQADAAEDDIETQDQALDGGLKNIYEQRKEKQLVTEIRDSLGARIVDGIKRAWRGVKAFLKGVFREAKQLLRLFIKNVTRLITSLVHRSYAFIHDVMKAFKAGLEFAIASTPKFSDKFGGLAIHKGLGGDIASFVAKSADISHVLFVYKRMNLASRSFHLSTNILIRLIQFFISAIAQNWLGLLIAIARTALRWTEYVGRFQLLQTIGKDIEAIDATLSAAAIGGRKLY